MNNKEYKQPKIILHYPDANKNSKPVRASIFDGLMIRNLPVRKPVKGMACYG